MPVDHCNNLDLSCTGNHYWCNVAAVVRLVSSMRSSGRRLDFLDLTATMLGDEAASLIADALNPLPAHDPAAEAETVEILQVALSEPARHQLQLRRCQSAPQPGQLAGASNSQIDRCALSGAAFTLEGH